MAAVPTQQASGGPIAGMVDMPGGGPCTLGQEPVALEKLGVTGGYQPPAGTYQAPQDGQDAFDDDIPF